MSEIEQKIEELRGLVSDNLRSREDIYYELGRILLEEDAESDDSPMPEFRDSALEISSRISLMDHQVSEIESLEFVLQDDKTLDSEVKERKKTLQENLNLQQETLGEELFHLINSQGLDAPWTRAYDPLINNMNKIRDNESELYQTENQVQGNSFFKGLARKSRMTMLKGRKKAMENSRSRLYQKCFHDALKLGAGQGDGKDAELLAPWFRLDKEWQEFLKDEDGREEKRSSAKDRLKELSGVRGPKKRKDFLSKEKDAEIQRLREALVKWGESVCGDAPDLWKDKQEVKDAISRIDTLTEDALVINHDIEKWEARRDIEQLKHDRAYMAEKIETLEEEIQNRRQEIRSLKKEMTASAKEIEKKKALAGDPDEEDAGE